jgi:cysteinyl-tRNA synthetase
MTSLIEQIVARGYGYIVKGNVYLDIEKVSNFGELSRLTKEHMLIKAKEFEEDLANPNKKHPLDITLWRAEEQQPPHIPSFFSTFGKGRPGWHIECSAMAISSLGEQIDIHGGGYDLIFPHHESEIAQSETATGKIPFVKYWMHTGTVHINGKKMSKSLGNLILVSDLLKTYSPNALRFLFLSHHYREPWNFNEQELKDAQKTCDLIENLLSDDDVSSRKESYKKKVISYLSNDLDTPSVLLETVKESQKKTKNTKEIKDILTMLGFTF